MSMEEKICFVIMGFGKKTDFTTGVCLDLDKTYHNVIKPAVEECQLRCVRADEVQDTGLIDRSMYALLIRADVVIADISTMNPNAIYELGVRHAVKPQSTIIIKAESTSSIPFDLNHDRVFSYKHLGEDIGVDEAKRMQTLLKEKLQVILREATIDSPMYEYIHTLSQPSMSNEEYKEIVGILADKTNNVFAITEAASQFTKEGKFKEAIKYWSKAHEKYPLEPYYIQQLALCIYKQTEGDVEINLNDALGVLNEIKDTNDPETFGLRGAINKRLCEINENNVAYLDRAIENYQKGYMLNFDFYTGENLAYCYDFKASLISDADEKIFCKWSAKKIRNEILTNLSKKIEFEDIKNVPNVKWMLATLASCCFCAGEKEQGEQYEQKFLEMAVEWEKHTYHEQKEKLHNLLNNQ